LIIQWTETTVLESSIHKMINLIQNKFFLTIDMIKKALQQKAYKLFYSRAITYHKLLEYPIGMIKSITRSLDRKIHYLLLSPTDTPRSEYIILLHPYLSAAKDFYITNGHVQLYQSLGYHVVVIDFNGFGESPFIDFDFPSDVKAVVDDVIELYQPNRIYGHGVSFGASHLIVYSTLADSKFDRIIIENCLDSNTTYYKKRSKKLYYFMRTLMKLFPSVNARHDYIKQGEQIRQPSSVLLIYNDDDSLTTVEMGLQIAEKLNIPHEFWVARGKHLEALKLQPEAYRNKVLDFLTGE